ncbi:antibiotic biosynthesis monooxygenase family protein [Streptomyces sp. NPDC048442]|uniref:antibiotic biosynthesis monooxygenase family protein n=1 Tax=Streptomyces sp. NPDC048442 TaxID=3154823 RepID=UPI003437D661
MITFINRFTVTGPAAEFERVFDETSEFFAAQPGFLGHRLVRHTSDPAAYVNIADWQDDASFQQALRQPEFAPHRAALRELSTGEPNLYAAVSERVA